jgi:hypothetical protein
MSTEAQRAANHANAQYSTGPKSPQGKAAISQNNFRHGLSAHFQVLPWEPQCEYDALFGSLRLQHEPETCFEVSLVEKMAQHYWLSRRALSLQETCFDHELPLCEQEKQLALYLRYQTTHDRAFQRCSDELRKLRNEKRKAEIGFESQQRKQKQDARREAEEARRQANENRKQELHQWAVLLAEAKFTHQEVLTSGARLPQILAQMREEAHRTSDVGCARPEEERTEVHEAA